MRLYRQKSYTVDEAMEAALWAHWCDDHKEANRLLRLVINYVIRKDNNGQGRQ